MEKKVLRTQEAALYVGLSESTLEKLRLYGGGPRFVRLRPRAVGYRVDDLDAWLESREAGSTSEIAAEPAAVGGSPDAIE